MSDADIKREFLKQKIVPWDESYLYHGTPPKGLACILKNGLYCAGSHDLDFCLLSTSNNDNVLTLFSEVNGTTGLVFNPKFKKVLVLDDFWYDVLYGMSGTGAADMWDDRVAENPEDGERAEKMGLWDGSEFKYESGRFLETFLPKDVEAIMFPAFREDKGGNTESEMAVTTAGMKVLEKSIEYIYIDGKEFDSADAARKHLDAEGIECDEGENPPRPLRLFHGTTQSSAIALQSSGWKPGSGIKGSQQGQTKYLYVTTDPENARWFAEEKGDGAVLEITGVPIDALIPDPEDSTYDTVEDELAASVRTGTPATLAVTRPLAAKQFRPLRKTRSNPPERAYYISSGMKNGFYTLRVKFDEPTYYKSEFGVVSTGIIAKDHYVMTLTKDPETAAAKANAYLKEIGQALSRPDFNLTGYLRGATVDWMIFHGGKYEGHDVEYVVRTDPEYAIWAAENLSGNRYDGTVAILQEVLAPQLAERAKVRATDKAAFETRKAQLIELLAPLAEQMRDGGGGCRDSVADEMARGSLPSGRGRSIAIDILAKAAGRRNSKAYEDARDAVTTIFEQAEALEAQR